MRAVDEMAEVKSRISTIPWHPIALVVSLAAVAALIVGLARMPTPTSATATAPAAGAAAASVAGGALLPGDQMWGAWPSYLFGTNDTQNWDPQHSFEMEPAIQQELKADHFPFIRVWFFQKSLIDGSPVTDVEQLTRMQAAQNAGMTCLGELPTANTMAYDEHIVTLMKGKCALYEFMNEPDAEGVQSAAYVTAWKSEIPKLRALDPGAKFGGPADYNYQGSQCTYSADGTSECFMQKVMQGMVASGVLPDFITFHWYPCWQDNASSCLAKASSYATVTDTVKGWVQQYFHKSIPVGITEWNADPSAPMPSYTKDAAWMSQFTTKALQAMQSAGLSFANQFDLANAGGYLTDDMVDIYHNGAPKPQYLAMKSLIAQARAGGGTAPAASPSASPSASPATTAQAGAATPSTGPLAPGSVVFSDDFESGNTTQWTKVSAASGDSIAVTTTTAHQGTHALAIQKAAGSGDVSARKALASGLTTANLSFAARLDHPMGHGMLQFAEALFGQSGQYFLGGIYLVYNASTGDKQLQYLDGRYQWHTCTAAPSYGAWHVFDLQLVSASDATGSFTLKMDGAVVCSASNIATASAGATGLSGLAFGSIGSDASAGMDITIDDVRLTA
ncbi:MAG TPA: hypothetical protein VFN78_07095 [Ktedonobacterales bacterium]|nr:hypothetical protein [Ktedonobacterales bacterium]